MANEQNLTGKGIDSTEKARELGRKGGKVSGESKRKKKTFTQLISIILQQPITEQMARTIQKAFGIYDQELSLKEAMIYAQTIKAIKNQDTVAFNALVDRVEGKPLQKQQIEGEIKEKRIYIEKEEKNNYEEHINEIVEENE